MRSKTIVAFALIVSMMMILPAAAYMFSPASAASLGADFNSNPVTVGGVRTPDEAAMEIEPIAVIGDLESGFKGSYFNLPEDHPDIGGAVTGVVTGDNPFNHDWYDAQYFCFERIDQDLTFGNGFFPVDTGLPGDPNYFAVHWETNITVPDADNYSFEMGSDDDSWLYIDDAMVIDLGGVHALSQDTGTVFLDPGVHSLDIYFAERHLTQSGFYFEFLDPRVDIQATVIWDDITAEAGEPVFLKGSCSYDLDGTIESYSWDFGDGATGTGSELTHVYARPGNYTVTLTVTDNAGLQGSDTCPADITGEYVDVYIGEDDITVVDPTVAEETAVVITVHGYDPYPGSGVGFTLDVYLDEVSPETLLCHRSGLTLQIDWRSVSSFAWTPETEGQHEIIAVVSNVIPTEIDLSNNTASKIVNVAAEPVLLPPNIEYWIEYIDFVGETTVDPNGITFYSSELNSERRHTIPFNDTFVIPPEDYGTYPLYNGQDFLRYRLHITNLNNASVEDLYISIIQEMHNTNILWDDYGSFSAVKGLPLDGAPARQWLVDIGPGDEIILDGYHINCGRYWGLDQTHLRVMWNGQTIVDNPEAGIYCPPP